jgi:hypothetical protein
MDEIIKVRSEYPPTVPLSVLALDLAEPAEGWPNFLGARAIAIIPDDLRRDCVSRGDALRLLDEKREQELRRAALARLQEQEAVAEDARRRAQIWGGVPASALPEGAAPAAVMLEAARQLGPRRKSGAAAFLDGDSMVLHPIHEPADES